MPQAVLHFGSDGGAGDAEDSNGAGSRPLSFRACRMTQTLRDSERASPRKYIFTAIKYAICIAAIVFVIIALKKNLRDFDWHNFHPQLGPVLLAALSIAAVTVTQIIAYRLLLAAYGPKLTWPQAATLSWVPGLAKYIPGKVVAIGGTVYLLRSYKIPAP